MGAAKGSRYSTLRLLAGLALLPVLYLSSYSSGRSPGPSLATSGGAAQAPAGDPRCAGIGRRVDKLAGGGAAWQAATPLFDLASPADTNATCPHCAGPDDILFCCGVCVLEHRFCSEQWPGQDVSQRVLGDLRSAGHSLEELTPCELFLRIKGRTLWFMGDSQTWHFYLAVECFLHEFAVDFQRRNVTDDPLKRVLLRPVTQSKERWSLCLHLVEGTRLCVVRVDDAQTMTRDIFPTLRTLGDMTNDVLIYNVGLHHPPVEEIYGAQLQLLGDYIQANSSWLPHMVWMDVPPQHFPTATGMFSVKGRRRPCKPLPDIPVNHEGGKYNSLAAKYTPRLGQAHLQLFDATAPFHYAHMNRECTHFCSPGPYQFWTYLLNRLLRDRGLGNPVPGVGGEAPAAAPQLQPGDGTQLQLPGPQPTSNGTQQQQPGEQPTGAQQQWQEQQQQELGGPGAVPVEGPDRERPPNTARR